MDKFQLEQKIVEMIKTVYDPEIPVNIYDLGLIYRIEVKDDSSVEIDMTLTAPNCPAADFMMEDVRQKVEGIEGVGSVSLVSRVAQALVPHVIPLIKKASVSTLYKYTVLDELKELRSSPGILGSVHVCALVKNTLHARHKMDNSFFMVYDML